eukprot:scaffold278485_cov33-Tisochrysis_lutea.AAC.5
MAWLRLGGAVRPCRLRAPASACGRGSWARKHPIHPRLPNLQVQSAAFIAQDVHYVSSRAYNALLHFPP